MSRNQDNLLLNQRLQRMNMDNIRNALIQRESETPLIPVRTFSSNQQAEVFRSSLLAQGIPCFLTNENYDPHTTKGVEEIDLIIRHSDAVTVSRLISMMELSNEHNFVDAYEPSGQKFNLSKQGKKTIQNEMILLLLLTVLVFLFYLNS